MSRSTSSWERSSRPIVMMGLAKLLIDWDMASLTAPVRTDGLRLPLFALYQFGQLHLDQADPPDAGAPGRHDPDRPRKRPPAAGPWG